MAVDYKALGLRIKNAREKRRLTQERLAELVDLSVPHISHIENGHTKASLESIVSIANALETSVDSLLHDNVVVSYTAYDKDFKDLLDDCSIRERQIIYETACQLAESIKK